MDVQGALISRRLVAEWPDQAFDRLLAVDFIRETGAAAYVGCPICHGAHDEKVVIAEQSDGTYRYYLKCPVVLRAEVTADDLRQWTINFEAFTKALARTIGLQGRCATLLPERLWSLGRVAWQGQRRKVLFARGLHWRDGAMVIDRIHSHHRPIILVTYRESPEFQPTDVPPVVPLEEIASLRENDICLDRVLMVAMIDEADAAAQDDDRRTPNSGEIKQLVRRQVKAERKAELTDDLLIAAYKQEGSYRKAAAALVAANMKTSLWAIRRAVERAGGVSVIRRKQ
jgi:hypothetical protein